MLENGQVGFEAIKYLRTRALAKALRRGAALQAQIDIESCRHFRMRPSCTAATWAWYVAPEQIFVQRKPGATVKTKWPACVPLAEKSRRHPRPARSALPSNGLEQQAPMYRPQDSLSRKGKKPRVALDAFSAFDGFSQSRCLLVDRN